MQIYTTETLVHSFDPTPLHCGTSPPIRYWKVIIMNITLMESPGRGSILCTVYGDADDAISVFNPHPNNIYPHTCMALCVVSVAWQSVEAALLHAIGKRASYKNT